MPDAPRRPSVIDPWFSRLRPVRPEDEALDQLLAEAAETLGFRSAAIVLARETTGEFEYVALHGDDDARELLHTHLARDHVLAQVEAADVLGVVRHLSAEARADLGFVAPGAPRASARSWHPDDLLVAALKEGADLRGLLVLDDPIDGKAPSDASKARIHDWTRSHCAQVLARDEHRRADEGAGLAESAVTILRLLRAGHPSPVDRAQACLEALRVALDGRLVLAHLERTAAESGVRAMVLETGAAQPEAIALYTSSGYEPVPGFGHYRDSPLSRCFGKVLQIPPVDGVPPGPARR